MRKKFLLRIDQQLWEDINRWAQDELRSVNGQMEYLLRRAVQARKKSSSREVEKENRERPDE